MIILYTTIGALLAFTIRSMFKWLAKGDHVERQMKGTVAREFSKAGLLMAVMVIGSAAPLIGCLYFAFRLTRGF